MPKHISVKLAKSIKENPELIELLKDIILEANFLGQKGQSISNVTICIKKKNWLLLRFVDEAWIDWEENC